MTGHEISTAHKTEMQKNADFFAFKLSDIVLSMLIKGLLHGMGN